MRKMNDWLLRRAAPHGTYSFGLHWTATSDPKGASIDPAELLGQNQEADVWIHPHFTHGDITLSFSHKLVDTENWALLTMNE